MLKIALFFLSASAAIEENATSGERLAISEELNLERNELIENIEAAIPECFYDGDFKEMRESPYPLNEGDKLLLVRTIASEASGRVALTFCKHNRNCSIWKRFSNEHFSLSNDAKEVLEVAKRFLIAGSIIVIPALIGGSLITGGVAGIVWISGGASYAVAYALGAVGGAFTGLLTTGVLIVPLAMGLSDAPISVSPKMSCCAYENDNQFYSVVYSSEEAAKIARKYALKYVKKSRL